MLDERQRPRIDLTGHLLVCVAVCLVFACLLGVAVCAPLMVHRSPINVPAGYEYYLAEVVPTVKVHGPAFTTGPYDDDSDAGYAACNYDPGYGWYRLYQLTGDTAIRGYATDANDVWRDVVSVPASGNVAGYYNYTDGLRIDWVENGDTASRDALLDQAVSAPDGNLAIGMDRATDADELIHEPRSREAAYVLEGYINAEVHAGMTHTGKMEAIVECILGDIGDDAVWLTTLDMPNGGHIEQWLDDYVTDADGNYVSGSTDFVSTNFAPFMGAITMHAIARHYDKAASINGGITPDTRTIPKIERLLDAMWNTAWGTANNAPDVDSFYYRPDDYDGDGSLNVDDSDDSDARTYALNNMIAYCYWWAYWKTGESRHLTRGDAIFAGGNNWPSLTARGAIQDPFETYRIKELNESLRRTIDGFEVRAAGVALHAN